MNREQRQILQHIHKIEKQQARLLEKAHTPQQQFFQIVAQKHLLSQKMIHKHIDDVLEYMPGSFSAHALNQIYLQVCLEMKLEVDPQTHPLLNCLVNWTQNYPSLHEEQELSLMEIVTVENMTDIDSYQSYLSYLTFISGDLLKYFKRKNQSQQLLAQSLDGQQLLTFLLNILPKVLYNIILPNNVLPPQYRMKSQSMQILYRVSSYEYIIKSRQSYASLIKFLVKTLIKINLKQSSQKVMMEVVFRYFYLYHHDKKHQATDIFIEAYNSLNQAVRFAMADQFLLFLRIAKKVGKQKFVEFLEKKSEWIRSIKDKADQDKLIGYAKENLNPFSTIRTPQHFTVPSGQTEVRYFQILQDFSLFYFNIDIISKDITVKLYFLGDCIEPHPHKTELVVYEKKSGNIKANVMATKRGIYMFQFDNTYSWMKNKEIKYENIVLSPLEFQSEVEYKWLPSYYNNLPMNQLADKNKIIKLTEVSHKPEIHYDGVANITKIGKFYNLKLGKGHNMYEFETENQDKLVQKFTELVDQNTKIKWMIAGQPLDQNDDLRKILIKKELEKEEHKNLSSKVEEKAEGKGEQQKEEKGESKEEKKGSKPDSKKQIKQQQSPKQKNSG